MSSFLDNGTVLGGYRLESVLGSGGTGVVYLATKLDLSRAEALKVLAPELRDDLVFRLHGKRVVRAYFHNFHRVWRSPKASRPIPTRAFGTLSRLAPVPGAAGLSGVAGVAPETDELESPELGVGELSGFDQD